MKLALVVAMVAGMVGCNSKVESAHWESDVSAINIPFCNADGCCTELNYVRDRDKRILAQVTQYAEAYHGCEKVFHVWHNGAGYGEFLSLDGAKARAVWTARTLGDNTF